MEATTLIRKCRVCGNSNLTQILDLGSQAATGVFPKSPDKQVFRGPLQLIKCVEDSGADTCDDATGTFLRLFTALREPLRISLGPERLHGCTSTPQSINGSNNTSPSRQATLSVT